jgi:hypothetical protein
LGETLGRSRLPFIPYSAYDGVNRWTQMSLELFGDPQLSLPRHAALALALTAPQTVDVGSGGIPAHVTEDGVAKPGVVVTAYRESEGIATATTDAQGDATVPFVALAPGEISLTARQAGSPTQVGNIDAIVSTGAPGPPGGTRLAFALPQPNPSSRDVRFRWSVPAGLADAPSRLVLHDLAGRVVRAWEAGAGAAAARNMTWDGRDAAGREAPAGLYIARLVVGDKAITRLVVRTR